MKLQAGELCDLITIERRSDAVDSTGDLDRQEWISEGSYWGKLTPLSPKNVAIAKGFATTVSHNLYLRHLESIDSNCRVTCRGKVYEVSGVVHDPQGWWTQVFLTWVGV